MANECLVTKLKGVVDNPKLEVLNYLKIWFYGSEIPSSGLYRTGNDLDPIGFYDASGNLIQSVAPNDGWLRYQDVNATVRALERGYFMVKKYQIDGADFAPFHNTGISLDDFKYSSLMRSIKMYNVNGGDLSSIAHLDSISRLDNQTYPGTRKSITGSIELFKNKTFGESFTIAGMDDITGNVEELAESCLNSSYFTITGDTPLVTGTLEGFVARLEAVRTSGTLKFNVGGTSVTYDGRRLLAANLTFTQEGCTISDVKYME